MVMFGIVELSVSAQSGLSQEICSQRSIIAVPCYEAP